jgi:hypothetical protein
MAVAPPRPPRPHSEARCRASGGARTLFRRLRRVASPGPGSGTRAANDGAGREGDALSERIDPAGGPTRRRGPRPTGTRPTRRPGRTGPADRPRASGASAGGQDASSRHPGTLHWPAERSAVAEPRLGAGGHHGPPQAALGLPRPAAGDWDTFPGQEKGTRRSTGRPALPFPQGVPPSPGAAPTGTGSAFHSEAACSTTGAALAQVW